MNSVVAGITYRAVLGRRRVLLLLLLPLLLIGLAILLRALGSTSESAAVRLMQVYAVGTMLPLLGLIAGTGTIAPEIDDGTIIHLLSKPIPRPVIAVTKFAVAASLLALFAAVPTYVAGYIILGDEAGIAAGFALGALVGGIAYAGVFLFLGVVTRHAVTVGIIYAVVWENLVGGYVQGAKNLSIQQWAQTIAAQVSTSNFFEATVSMGFAVPAVLIVTVGSVLWAGRRLRTVSLAGEE